MRPLTISGTGYCYCNNIFKYIDFNSTTFKKYLSTTNNDGGLVSGKTIFSEDIEKFAGEKLQVIMHNIMGDKSADDIAVAGSAIVSLSHIAQLLYRNSIKVNYYGCLGSDDMAKSIMSVIKKTPLITTNIKKFKGLSAFNYVLSDLNTNYTINSLGCAALYDTDNLDINFFLSDIVLFAGTALVPNIHNHLDELLRKAQEKHSFTVVSTVFDCLSEKQFPGNAWLLLKNINAYKDIDLLIMNYNEALKISGKKSIASAIDFFIYADTGAFIITHSENNIKLYSSGKLFKKQELIEMPISNLMKTELKQNMSFKASYTSCGDNFIGGVIASFAMQLQKNTAGNLDLIEACALGIVSGGYACYYNDNIFIESTPGEKWDKLAPYFSHYIEQLRDENIANL